MAGYECQIMCNRNPAIVEWQPGIFGLVTVLVKRVGIVIVKE